MTNSERFTSLAITIVLMNFGLSACGSHRSPEITESASKSSIAKKAGDTISSQVAVFGVNFAGGEFGDIGRPYGQGYIYPELSTLQYFASKGMKFGRLPFKWERVQPQLFSPLNSDEVARLRRFLDDANSVGIKILIDMHNYGQYQFGDGRKPHVGEDPALPSEALQDAWKRLAQTLKGHPALVGYDIMNEPQGFSNPNGRTWYRVAQETVSAIRTVDMDTAIYVEGDCWASAAEWVRCSGELDIKDPANNIVYSAHQYFDRSASGDYDGKTYDGEGITPQTGVDRLRPFVEWLKSKGARGHIGEYGVPNNDPRYNVVLENALKYMAENCISGTYWAAGPWWGDYLLSVEPKDGQDRPQMSVLGQYTTRACANQSATPAPTPATTTPPAPTSNQRSNIKTVLANKCVQATPGGLRQQECADIAEQKFEIVSGPADTVRLVIANQICIELPRSSSFAAGLAPCTDSAEQLFTLKAQDDGSFAIRTADNRCMDVANNSHANGAEIGFWNCEQGLKQSFRLVP